MRSGQCLLFLQCYVITLATKPRSVNLALETTFEFNNKQDVSIIQKVRNFLNKIENAVDTKLAKRNEQTEFTDFLQDLIITINGYEDDDFKEVFNVLDDVVRNFKSKDTKFNRIYNERLKYQLTEMLRKINKAPAKFLRSQLKRNIRLMQKDINNDFFNFLNLIYKKKSPTLKKILSDFKKYGKKTRTSDVDLNLRDMIENGVKSIISEQYIKLNDDKKHDIQSWIKTLTNDDDDKETKTSKKHVYKKKKYDTKRPKYTFVTLYPEMITFNMKYLDKTTVRSKKKEKIQKEIYNNYAIKESSPAFSSDSSNSSDSMENVWITRPPLKKRVTPSWHTIPRPMKVKFPQNKPFRIYNSPYQYQLPHMLRRTELDEKENNTKNFTCPKEIITANYLSKIKKLEDELQRVREQLKAKITTLTKMTGDTGYIEKDNLYFRVSDLSSPVTLKRDWTSLPKMLGYRSTDLKNITEENTTKYSEEVSHESREIAFDLPYNITYRSTNHSIYLSNQTSMEIFSPGTTIVKNITTIKPMFRTTIILTNFTDIEDTTVSNVKKNVTLNQEAVRI